MGKHTQSIDDKIKNRVYATEMVGCFLQVTFPICGAVMRWFTPLSDINSVGKVFDE